MARLSWHTHEVACVDWPGTLLAMLRTDVLGPHARLEALKILALSEQKVSGAMIRQTVARPKVSPPDALLF